PQYPGVRGDFLQNLCMGRRQILASSGPQLQALPKDVEMVSSGSIVTGKEQVGRPDQGEGGTKPAGLGVVDDRERFSLRLRLFDRESGPVLPEEIDQPVVLDRAGHADEEARFVRLLPAVVVRSRDTVDLAEEVRELPEPQWFFFRPVSGEAIMFHPK